jgi:tRNA A37 threonylcarbamoyladenosine dehydratase
MKEELEREVALLGEDALKKLNNSFVAVFGLGGVGSYTAEALARSGIGKILLVDNDAVSKSNINRQLCALQSTVGRKKVDVVAERLLDINPDLIIERSYEFVLPENISSFDFSRFDYVIDAIDTVSAKLAIAESAKEHGVPMISSMGTGNKLDPTALTVTDITKTTVCPLARVMRRELKKRGIFHLKVVFSTEEPKRQNHDGSGKLPPASVAFVPSVAGLIAAGEAIKDIIKN